MARLLVILNPFIWLWNFSFYCAHLETQKYCDRYEGYDFTRDVAYFRWDRRGPQPAACA